MQKDQFITTLYNAVDQSNAKAIVELMDENASFRFANIPAVNGKGNILNFLETFFTSIKGIKHSDLESWSKDDVKITNGNVTYTRKDDSQLSVPFSVTLKMKNELINDYLIFVDTSELYSVSN